MCTLFIHGPQNQRIGVTLVGGFKTIIEPNAIFKKSKDLGQRTCPKPLVFSSFKVNWPVIKHLSIQDRLDPRGGLHCF
jgi:hypothetical protein